MSIDEMRDINHIHKHYGFPLEITCTIPKKDYLKIAWHFFWHLAPRTIIVYAFVVIPLCFTLTVAGFSAAYGFGFDLSSLPYTGSFSLIAAILYFIYIYGQLNYFHTNCEKGLKRTYHFTEKVVAIYEDGEKITDRSIDALMNNFEKGEYVYFSSYDYGDHLLFCIPARRIPHDFFLFLKEDRSWESNHPIIES